jgi:hypothetical protein
MSHTPRINKKRDNSGTDLRLRARKAPVPVSRKNSEEIPHVIERHEDHHDPAQGVDRRQAACRVGRGVSQRSVGTSRFSASTQFRTMTTVVGAVDWSRFTSSLITRKRLPSGDTS